jgi:hypothetical protein
MAEADKAAVVDVIRFRHPTAAVFQARKAVDTYALQFTTVL